MTRYANIVEAQAHEVRCHYRAKNGYSVGTPKELERAFLKSLDQLSVESDADAQFEGLSVLSFDVPIEDFAERATYAFVEDDAVWALAELRACKTVSEARKYLREIEQVYPNIDIVGQMAELEARNSELRKHG